MNIQVSRKKEIRMIEGAVLEINSVL